MLSTVLYTYTSVILLGGGTICEGILGLRNGYIVIDFVMLGSCRAPALRMLSAAFYRNIAGL